MCTIRVVDIDGVEVASDEVAVISLMITDLAVAVLASHTFD